MNCVSGEARITITSYKKTGVGGGSNGCRDWGWTRNQAENPGSGWIGISVPLKPHKFWIPLKCFCIPNPGGFWLSLKVEESSHHLFLANSSQPIPPHQIKLGPAQLGRHKGYSRTWGAGQLEKVQDGKMLAVPLSGVGGPGGGGGWQLDPVGSPKIGQKNLKSGWVGFVSQSLEVKTQKPLKTAIFCPFFDPPFRNSWGFVPNFFVPACFTRLAPTSFQ